MNIDDDVLAAVKSLAAQRQQSLGDVVSDLVRQSLTRPTTRTMRTGVPLLTAMRGSQPVTMELVNELRDGDQEV